MHGKDIVQTTNRYKYFGTEATKLVTKVIVVRKTDVDERPNRSTPANLIKTPTAIL